MTEDWLGADPLFGDQDNGQDALFNAPPAWTENWKGMPSFEHKDFATPMQEVVVRLRSDEDRKKFAELMGQQVTPLTHGIWFPKSETVKLSDKYWATKELVQPRYPVYVISKGRWESRMTSKALERIGVDYRIVIEPQEYDQYAAVIDERKILVLPFSNLGQGSIPARNWVFEHSVANGDARHWILDDNIRLFFRYHQNATYPVGSGAIFRALEDFTDRYENVAQSGMNYFMFVPRKEGRIRPYTLNTRIYSCILNNNSIPFRWRGRYNEDTDLSIRCLKAGWCTILFQAFLAEKMPTMTMKGGNTESLYKLDGEVDGRLLMAESLAKQHPDCVRVTERWGRPQHYVDYSMFKHNELKPVPGVVFPDEPNEYGMFIKEGYSGSKAEKLYEEPEYVEEIPETVAPPAGESIDAPAGAATVPEHVEVIPWREDGDDELITQEEVLF